MSLSVFLNSEIRKMLGSKFINVNLVHWFKPPHGFETGRSTFRKTITELAPYPFLPHFGADKVVEPGLIF